MSTILKETEAIAGLPEGAPARPAATSAESGAKPQPVALEVSVTVNGARTVEGSEKREPFSESTKTVLVFGNGAVIRLQASVAPGQLLFLTNEKTKKEVVCQVVKSKNYRNISGYVELEFTEAVVGFWGMRFPGDRVAGQPGTPNVVQATAATGSPVAPLAPAVAIAPPVEPKSPAPLTPAATATPTTIPAPAKPAPSVAASTPIAPSTATANAPAIPAAPAVPLVVKTDFSVSSSAPKTVLPLTGTLSLPRAAEAKPAAPAVPKAPASVTPATPIAPVATTPASAADSKAASSTSGKSAEPVKPAAELSADSLRAENARLQEQLAALLNPQKNNAAPPVSVPVTVAPVATAPETANAKPAVDAAAKIRESAPAESAKPESVASTPGKPDSWLPDLAAVLAQDAASTKAASAPRTTAPVAPVIPIAPPKPVAPANISTASLQSLLEEEQVKIPSWLEPLARNAAPASAVDEGVSAGASSGAPMQAHDENELHDELDDVFEHRNDDLSETLAKTQEDGTADESRNEEGTENVAVPTFGARLSIDEGGSTEGSGKGKVLAIAALLVAAVAGGGYWYTQQNGAAATRGAQSTPAINAQTETAVPASAAGSQASQPAPRTLPSATGVTAPSGTIKNQAANPINQTNTPAPVNANLVVEKTRGNASPAAGVVNPVQQEPAAPKHALLGDVHLAAPNVTHKGDSGAVSDAEISLGNGDAESAPLVNGFASTSGPAAPAAPVQIGGAVSPAKLLKSVPPIYPAFAKTQRVSGDVKIDALIDATGRVTTMKVVSGPTVLHEAAMDALRQWKYQAASLDGKPVQMHLTVTIQFRLQ